MIDWHKTAKKYNIEEKTQYILDEIAKIKDVTSVDVDLTGWLSDIKHFILIVGFDIRADRDDYFEAHKTLKKNIIDLCYNNDLHRTSDQIEDMGEHYYMVFKCGKSWSVLTETESENKGMSEWDIAYGFLTGEIIPDREHLTPNEKEHGKVVGSRFEPYHDVTIYEDGFEDWDYIGD